MADKATTTGSKKESATDKIERLKAELRAALIEAGQDPGTVDAQMYALRLPTDSVVGNLADLQRMGAQAAAEGA